MELIEPPKKEGRLSTLFSTIKMSIFKKPKTNDAEDIKLKKNPFNDPALSRIKQSMKNDLMADSVFTRNSKLTSYSTTSELMNNNSAKFRKFVNEKGRNIKQNN
jgi:hypothetical protein